MKISLCIPTMDRYDSFLKKNLTKYLEFDLIDEIVISDENGNDYEKIKNEFNNDKIKLYKNDQILGPFLNKLRVCSLSENNWVVLIDSDNFAPYEYFQNVKNFLKENKTEHNTVLLPSFARPFYRFNNFIGKNINKRNLYNSDILIMNVGNYVINKNLLKTLNLNNEQDLIQNCSACDVIFLNTLLLEQTDVNFIVLKNLEYDHETHNGSIYLNTINKVKKYCDIIYGRFENLKCIKN